MASPELKWALDVGAANRAKAGVSDDFFDPLKARASLHALDLPMPAGGREERIEVNGLRCIWVTTPKSAPDRRMLMFHGGAYCAGSYDSHRTFVAWLAEATGYSILFPEYRLAPEHRFPAAVDDSETALRWIDSNGPGGRVGKARYIVVSGDSAGGGLSVASMLRARSRNFRMPDAALLICAMLDLDEKTSKFLQMNQRSRDIPRLYVAGLEDLAHPEASPILADLQGLPPLLLQTGTQDYCRDDSVRFARRARDAGIKTTLEEWPDMFHVWQRYAPKLPEANQALEAMGNWLRTILGHD